MIVIDSLDGLKIEYATSVALGNFDGLHVGHRKIMEDAIAHAEATGSRSLCFTFSNHPFNFILRRNEEDPDAIKLICSEEEKIKLIEGMGFDVLVNVPFDETVMTMRAKAFFEDVLLAKLNAKSVSVGFNYRYGARAEGTPEMLRSECDEAGIASSVHEAVTIDGRIVSSTLIRELIADGDMLSVSRYLGRPLSFSGRVGHGRRLGSSRGYPTANIGVGAERCLPPSGVYFSTISINGREYAGVSNLGSKPTVQESGEKSIETYIFDFDGDLYGSSVEVFLERFSRPERRFGSKDELFDQIAEDCRAAAEYHRAKDAQKRG